MKTLKFSNTRLLIYGFILFTAFFSSIQQSICDINPQFGDCTNSYIIPDMNCGNIDLINEIIEIYPGCFIEVDYLLKICQIPNSIPHFKMELIGYRIINHSACSGLLNGLYLPNGNLNEAFARGVMQDIYQAVSDKWMKNFVTTNNLSAFNSWRCNEGFMPNNGIMFFEAAEGTCMALCKTTQVIHYYNHPFGVTHPGVLPPGIYTTEYISNVKCTNSCCLTYIAYCFDPFQNSWVRTTMKDSHGASIMCPNPPLAMQACVTPPLIDVANRIILSTSTQLYSCEQTCDQISSPEYLNW